MGLLAAASTQLPHKEWMHTRSCAVSVCEPCTAHLDETIKPEAILHCVAAETVVLPDLIYDSM